ncbi:MAG: restriction endonuclease [Bacteroidota bacterium]
MSGNQIDLSNIEVQKASGETEPFSVEKLIGSLESTGAHPNEIAQIVQNISGWIYNGVTTRHIYRRAYHLLQQKRNHLASRYKLKKAIMELGPTGFPFEHFVAKIFDAMGFSTLTGQVMNGCCVTHEMDVVAIKGKEEHLIECKYGKSPGKSVSVQVPLYVRSRVNDVIKKQKESAEFDGFTFHGWVVTNTRFTSDATDYGKCSGLHLLSWDYPAGKGMKDIIDREKIYPVTVLASLTDKQKQFLLEQDVVICRQLIQEKELINELDLPIKQFRYLMNELGEIT